MAELDQAAELAKEAVEETVSVARNHITWMWGGWFVGACIGTGTGYLIGRRHLELKYAKIAEDEISQMREHFEKRSVAREKKPDLEALKNSGLKAGEMIAENQGYTPSPPVSAAPPVPGAPNVAPPQRTPEEWVKPEWDWDVENELRTKRAIYVIHQDEYGEGGNEQMTLTYYAGDDVLCRHDDSVIDNQFKLVGDSMDRFGHGSDDVNTVYVRNETLSLDLEVIKNNKTYAEEVHGFRHEDPPRRRHPRHEE